MRVEVGEALLGLVDAGDVAGGHPPQRDKGAGELLEPLLPLAKQLRVGGAVDEGLERVGGFPNGQVEEDAVVIVGAEVGGVSRGGLQAPDEAGAAVGEGVDFIEPLDEASHERAVERGSHSGDVDLGHVVLGHFPSVAPDGGASQFEVYISWGNGGAQRLIGSHTLPI